MCRISVPMKEQIRHLYLAGYSLRGISRALKLSRNTVRKYLRLGCEEKSLAKPRARRWSDSIDWELLAKKRKQGVTIKQLHHDHSPEHVPYSTFADRLRKQVGSVKIPTVHLVHNPGEKTQVDYCDGIYLIDPKTGKKTKTHMFCGVLPFSSYTFAEFVMDQKLPSFIRSHQRMWSYYGGVSPYVVVDNLKSAVTKAHLYDPDVNQTYCDYGNHEGFAVLPARPYKPRDKAAVESAIGAIQRSFFQEVRERKFYSLHELNRVFREFLDRFNNRVMKDYGVSRRERFDEEKQYLLQLPSRPYQIKTWKFAKVHPDSTIQVAKNLYSVPYKYIGQTVKVKISDTLIEVFNEQLKLIASHNKLTGKVGQKAIKPAHYPSEKDQLTRFDIRRAKAQAQSVGPKMSQLIHKMFEGNRPLENLRRVQGILRLRGKAGISRSDMEYAASQCLSFNRYRVKYFEQCAVHHKNLASKPINSRPLREQSEIFLHSVRSKD